MAHYYGHVHLAPLRCFDFPLDDVSTLAYHYLKSAVSEIDGVRRKIPTASLHQNLLQFEFQHLHLVERFLHASCPAQIGVDLFHPHQFVQLGDDSPQPLLELRVHVGVVSLLV